MHLRSALIGVGLAALSVAALAQAPSRPVAFEVASVKPAASSPAVGIPRIEPGGRFSTSNATLNYIVSLAFGSHRRSEIVGAPDWFYTDRFDVTAKAGGDAAANDAVFAKQLPAMMRALLETRFKLRTHWDSKHASVYALVRKNANGRLGPDLHISSDDCPAPGTATVMSNASLPRCGIRILAPGSVSAVGQQMAAIAAFLTQSVDRLVIDDTGLSGPYDFTLRFDMASMTGRSNTSFLPSVFTAVQDQLGLKLEPTAAPVDVLVIDHVEKPTEN